MVNHSTSQVAVSRQKKRRGDSLEYIAKIASAPLKLSPTVYRFWLQSLARELLPKERVAKCLRSIAPMSSHVLVKKVDDANRAYYANLLVCGRIWHCPVCAARITEERRRELSAALAASNLVPVLVTYTVRHDQGMKLADLLDAMLKAYRSMKGSRAWSRLVDDYSWVGSVRSLEVTYGENGWHPHIHELVLLERKLSPAAENGLKVALKGHWAHVLARRGYSASWEHGVDVESRDTNIREYVAKFGRDPVTDGWTLEHELTKSPVKKGRNGGRTPTQLLADYGDGDIAAGRLFQEYARVFKGRNQLVWSRGLRELLGLGAEAADETVAADVPEAARVLARLSADQWRAILRGDLRGELLDQAAVGTDEGFYTWLAAKLEKWA